MELLIKAENARELKQKVMEAAAEFGGSKTVTVEIKGPTGKHTAQMPVQTTQTESIFGGDEAPAPVQAGGKKAKKTAAPPPPTPSEDEDAFGGDEDVATEETEAASEDEITREFASDMLRSVIAKCGANGARDLMAKLGYSHLAKVPEAELGTFVKACEKAIEKAKTKKK